MKILLFALTTTLPLLLSIACASAAPPASPPAPSSSNSSATTAASPRHCVTSTVIRPESIAARLQGDDSYDVDGIVALGESAVPPLIHLTKTSRDPLVRPRSADILGRFPCQEALDQLDALLSDSDFSVRLAAVVALAHARGRESTPQLVRVLAKDTDTGVLKFTIKELDRVGDKRALAPLKTFRDSTTHGWLRDRADAAIVAISKRGV